MFVSDLANNNQQRESQQPIYQPFPLKINVEFCINCQSHGPSLRHDQQKYIDTFNKIKQQLSIQISNNRVSLHANRAPANLKLVKNIRQQQPRAGNSIHLKKRNKFTSHQNYSQVDQEKIIHQMQQLRRISDAQNIEKYYDKIYQQFVMFPRIGAFQIYCNNTPIFSKLEHNQWPQIKTIVQKIQMIIREIQNIIQNQRKSDVNRQIIHKFLEKYDCTNKQIKNNVNPNIQTAQGQKVKLRGIYFRVKNGANGAKSQSQAQKSPTFFNSNNRNNLANFSYNSKRNKSTAYTERVKYEKQRMNRQSPQIEQLQQQYILSSKIIKGMITQGGNSKRNTNSNNFNEDQQFQRIMLTNKIQQIMVNKQKTNGPIRRRHFKQYNNIFLDFLVPKLLKQQLDPKQQENKEIQIGKWENKAQKNQCFFGLQQLKTLGFAQLLHERYDNHKQQILLGKKNLYRIETERKRRRTLSTKLNSRTNSIQRNRNQETNIVVTRQFENHLLAQEIAKVDFQNEKIFKRSDQQLVSGRKSQKTTRSRLILQKKMQQIIQRGKQSKYVIDINGQSNSIVLENRLEMPKAEQQYLNDYESLLRQQPFNQQFQNSQTNTIKLIVTNADREHEQQQLSFNLSRTNAENQSNNTQMKINYLPQKQKSQKTKQNVDQCIVQESQDKDSQFANPNIGKQMSSSVPIDSSQPLRAAAQKDRLQHSQKQYFNQSQVKTTQIRNVSDMLQITVSQQHRQSGQISISQREFTQISKNSNSMKNKHQQKLYVKFAQSKMTPQQEWQSQEQQKGKKEEEKSKQIYQYKVTDNEYEEMVNIQQKSNENYQDNFEIKITKTQRKEQQKAQIEQYDCQNSLKLPSDFNLPLLNQGQSPLQVLEKTHAKDSIPLQSRQQIEEQPRQKTIIQDLQVQQEAEGDLSKKKQSIVKVNTSSISDSSSDSSQNLQSCQNLQSSQSNKYSFVQENPADNQDLSDHPDILSWNEIQNYDYRNTINVGIYSNMIGQKQLSQQSDRLRQK